MSPVYASLQRERTLFKQGCRVVVGTDEVGMGPLAGPVVAAAVAIFPSSKLPRVRDSKTLSKRQRAFLAQDIAQSYIAWNIEIATPKEIDLYNIREAAILAHTRAIAGLPIRPDAVLADAFEIPNLPYKTYAIQKGDRDVASIAAASILAKVYRDALMERYDTEYPGYGFSLNKGYGTKIHLEALSALGPCPIHRRSYAPIQLVMHKKP